MKRLTSLFLCFLCFNLHGYRVYVVSSLRNTLKRYTPLHRSMFSMSFTSVFESGVAVAAVVAVHEAGHFLGQNLLIYQQTHFKVVF